MATKQPITINLAAGRISGTYLLPVKPNWIVLFALSSSRNRWKVRNHYVAQQCSQQGLAVLILDLLTRDEDGNAGCHLDSQLLCERLSAGIGWIRNQKALAGLPIGVFAMNAAAAAAFAVAAGTPDEIRAIVTCSAGLQPVTNVLPNVKCPTLLIIAGGAHPAVTSANESAYQRLRCKKKLCVVPGASPLFTEPEALQEMAVLASDWFGRFVRPDGNSNSHPAEGAA